MAKSPFFARIKADVLEIVRCIPEGRLCTFIEIGTHLDVVPRHIAYILSTLEDDQKMIVPWHRVVGEGGTLGTPKYAPGGASQSDCLAAEGVAAQASQIIDFQLHHIAVAETGTRVSKQSRPVDAPHY